MKCPKCHTEMWHAVGEDFPDDKSRLSNMAFGIAIRQSAVTPYSIPMMNTNRQTEPLPDVP